MTGAVPTSRRPLGGHPLWSLVVGWVALVAGIAALGHVIRGLATGRHLPVEVIFVPLLVVADELLVHRFPHRHAFVPRGRTAGGGYGVWPYFIPVYVLWHVVLDQLESVRPWMLRATIAFAIAGAVSLVLELRNPAAPVSHAPALADP